MKRESLVPREIATRWSCCRSSVITLIQNGALRAVNISTGKRARYIVLREDLERFEAERATPPPERPMPKRKRVRVPAGETIEFFAEG